MSGWEAVIGLEVHVQLATRTKLFCGCAVRFGDPPNAHTCPVCLGHPGALPVLNAEAVRLAARLGAALGCEVRPRSIFARKHYFYLDLPKGYQITQFAHPLCVGGGVPIEADGRSRVVPLTRIHLEEDAGKNLHGGADGRFDGSLIDLSRAGTPLVEVVSGPELGSIDEAVAYLKALHAIVVELGVGEGNMEQGQLRCDANVSVRRPGAPLGVRVEIKNLNSFRFLARALEHEIERQIDLLEAGGAVVQETRGFDAATGATRAQRGKEDAHDYRYFPEPDLGPLDLDPGWLDAIATQIPELPHARRTRYAALDLAPADAATLAADRALSAFFDQALSLGARPRAASTWLLGEVQSRLTRPPRPLAEAPLTPVRLVELLRLLEAGILGGPAAREVFDVVWATGEAPADVVARLGLGRVGDGDAIDALCAQVLGENPAQVAEYRAGKTRLLGFFVGLVMKASRGRADPQLVGEALRRRLEEDG